MQMNKVRSRTVKKTKEKISGINMFTSLYMVPPFSIDLSVKHHK